jgi:hypothetical protein
MGRCRKTSRLRLDTRFEYERFLNSLHLRNNLADETSMWREENGMPTHGEEED